MLTCPKKKFQTISRYRLSTSNMMWRCVAPCTMNYSAPRRSVVAREPVATKWRAYFRVARQSVRTLSGARNSPRPCVGARRRTRTRGRRPVTLPCNRSYYYCTSRHYTPSVASSLSPVTAITILLISKMFYRRDKTWNKTHLTGCSTALFRRTPAPHH